MQQIFSELFSIESIKKNTTLVVCLVWLFMDHTRIEALESRLNDCYLIKSNGGQLGEGTGVVKRMDLAIKEEELSIWEG